MNVRLEKRDAVWTLSAVALVAAYQALYFLAPAFLARPLWEDSSLTLAFLLGTLSIVIPVAVGWWMIRGDAPSGETFDTADH